MDIYRESLETFREEARELLASFEETLIQLEELPDDTDIIADAFRSLHTLKGSGSMFGFDHLVSFSHLLESLFSRIRDGKLGMSSEIINLGLISKDVLQILIGEPDPGEEILKEVSTVSRMIQALPGMKEHQPAPDRLPVPGVAGGTAQADNLDPQFEDTQYSSDDDDGNGGKTYRIRFLPGRDLFLRGMNPLILLKDLEALGQITVEARTEEIPPLEDIDQESCYYSWTIELRTHADLNSIKDIFIFIEDSSDISIEVLFSRTGSPEASLPLSEKENTVPQPVQEKGSHVSSCGISGRSLNSSEVLSGGSIRVRTEKLDRLVNLVGEFLAMQARLNRITETREDPELNAFSEQMEPLLRDLRDLSMELHMQPVETLFSGFTRLVRDIGKELGKEVVLTTEGMDTELDKNLIDILKDPLVHLVRNAIDHGIEEPDVREECGKDRRGTIRLASYYAGTDVVIEVEDDGAGIDTEKIERLARQKGFLSEEHKATREDLLSMIFHPGFSTTEEVSSLSGRGVGMDVVRKKIDSMKGTISVHSVQGCGTKFLLKLPLTLAIVEGLLVRIGEDFFMINVSGIVECIDFIPKNSASGRRIIDFRGECVPYIDIREFFEIRGSVPVIRQMVIIAREQKKIGLLVDSILDTYQTVVKPLQWISRDSEGVSGAVVLGDGRLALMLDSEGLIRLNESALQETGNIR